MRLCLGNAQAIKIITLANNHLKIMNKTKKGAAKRLRVNSNGLIKRKRAFLNHLLTKKSSKNKRHLRCSASVAKPDSKNIRQTLGI